MSNPPTNSRPVCDTCGRTVDRVRRDVIGSGYDALQKKPLWNCDQCYGKKRLQRFTSESASLLEGKQLFIAGFMATGKSKIGPLLAELLDRLFVDTDELVVEKDGRSIAEIFEQDGEDAFRQMERDAVAQTAHGSPAVIALGGGAVRQDANWDVIRAHGICLCITAKAEILSERIGRNEDRPLLAGLSDDERLDRIQEMLAERKPHYDRSDIFIESTEDRTPEEAAEAALRAIRQKLEQPS